MRKAELAVKAVISMSSFNGVEIFTLDILVSGDLQQFRIGHVLDDHGYVRQAGNLRRSPAALARNNLVRILVPPDDERLDDSVRSDRRGQFLNPVRMKY